MGTDRPGYAAIPSERVGAPEAEVIDSGTQAAQVKEPEEAKAWRLLWLLGASGNVGGGQKVSHQEPLHAGWGLFPPHSVCWRQSPPLRFKN